MDNSQEDDVEFTETDLVKLMNTLENYEPLIPDQVAQHFINL